MRVRRRSLLETSVMSKDFGAALTTEQDKKLALTRPRIC